jgi:hypothetical protein
LALAAMHVAAWAVTVSMLTALIKTRQMQDGGRLYR